MNTCSTQKSCKCRQSSCCRWAVIAVVVGIMAIVIPAGMKLSAKTNNGITLSDHQPVTTQPLFDHSPLNTLLKKYVDADGWVDYAGLKQNATALKRYVESLNAAPLDAMGAHEKLATLINAYNACTLLLIVERYPIKSIKDIPSSKRWQSRRWQIGGRTWSLNQIEHELIRGKFNEPRIHFALVCAAVSCPPLRNEVYLPGRLEQQLDEQATYSHARSAWYKYDASANRVGLTKLYDWYGSDFKQSPGIDSPLAYAAQYDEALGRALAAGKKPSVYWLDYDWSLNSKTNAQPR